MAVVVAVRAPIAEGVGNAAIAAVLLTLRSLNYVSNTTALVKTCLLMYVKLMNNNKVSLASTKN